MADLNGNGTIINAELQHYLAREMKDWCAAAAECAETGLGLTPHFDGDVAAPYFTVEPTTNQSEAVSDLKGGNLATNDDRMAFVSDLFAPQNEARLKMRVDSANPLKIGEAVKFQFRAERDGTLVLLDVNPDGELSQVYPSVLVPQGRTRLEAGQILTIPDAVSAGGLPLEIRVTRACRTWFPCGAVRRR